MTAKGNWKIHYGVDPVVDFPNTCQKASKPRAIEKFTTGLTPVVFSFILMTK